MVAHALDTIAPYSYFPFKLQSQCLLILIPTTLFYQLSYLSRYASSHSGCILSPTMELLDLPIELIIMIEERLPT